MTDKKYTHNDIVEYRNYLNGIIESINDDKGFFLNSGQLAKYYTYSRIGFYFDLLDLVDNLVGLENKKVCDMASGGGVLSNILYKFYDSKITSIDALECGIGFGKIHTPESIWINDNMFNLEDEFDLVFACEVLEHVLYPEKVLNKMLEKVKTGGDLVITVPDGRIDNLSAGEYFKETEAYSGHINFWSVESFQAYFREYNPQVFYLEGRGDERANKICAVFHA